MSAEEKSTEGNTEGTSDRLELGVSILGKRKFQPPMPTILNKTGKHKFKIEGLDSQSMELFSAFYKNPGEKTPSQISTQNFVGGIGRAIKLQKNRESASKSRKKKKVAIDALRENTCELSEEQGILRGELIKYVDLLQISHSENLNMRERMDSLQVENSNLKAKLINIQSDVFNSHQNFMRTLLLHRMNMGGTTRLENSISQTLNTLEQKFPVSGINED